jgi:hypothetical protein
MPDAQVVAPPQATVVPAPQSVPAIVAAPTAPVDPPSPAPVRPAAEPLPQGMVPGKDGRIQVLSQSAYKRLKDEAREKGRKEALSSFAKDSGFTTVEDLQRALTGFKNPQTPTTPEAKPPAQAPEPAPKSGSDKWDRERVQLQRQIDDLGRRVKTETEGRKEIQRQLDAKEAEMELREAAVIVGIKDPDYAIRLLTRSLESKSEEELAKFDHGKYFADLRTSHPYLFGEVVKPATTGTGAGAPAAPKPGEVAAAAVQNGKVDATKLSPEEYRALLAKRGLAINI